MQQLMQLHKSTIDFLKKGENLLAFSAGIDSSALFFLLNSYDIDFDIAIVDYNTRSQSKNEVEYARELSKSYNKRLFIHSCKLSSANFENNARAERYRFFENTIETYGYNNLIMAHQLNDKLEWFLMQFTKGGGVVEIFGMKEIEDRESYNIVRPLLNRSRREIEYYLQTNSIKHFYDKSNDDEKYLRNYFRKNFSNSLLEKFESGIKRSFCYIENDLTELTPPKYTRVKKLYIIPRTKNNLRNVRAVDKALKELGVVLSKKSRDEVKKEGDFVVARKFAITFTEEKIYIAPYLKTKMPKKFKERCRLKKIPPMIRSYIYLELEEHLENFNSPIFTPSTIAH